MATERIGWIDYAKGFGIILVVAVHNLTGLTAAGLPVPHFAYEFTRLAFSFFMPLFFFLSGLFVERSLRKGVAVFLKNKVATVLYPFCLWTILQGSVQSFMSRFVVHHVTLVEIVRSMFTRPLAQLWFLEALFVMFVLYAASRQMGLQAMWITFITGILSIAAFAVVDELAYKILWNFVFLCLGALLNTQVKELLSKVPNPILVGVAVGGAILHCMVLSINHLALDRNGILYVYAVVGILWVIAASELLSRKGWIHWLSIVGFYTMPILVMHIIVLNAMRFLLYHVARLNPRYLLSLPELIAGVVLPIMVARLMERYGWRGLLEWPFAHARQAA